MNEGVLPEFSAMLETLKQNHLHPEAAALEQFSQIMTRASDIMDVFIQILDKREYRDIAEYAAEIKSEVNATLVSLGQTTPDQKSSISDAIVFFAEKMERLCGSLANEEGLISLFARHDKLLQTLNRENNKMRRELHSFDAEGKIVVHPTVQKEISELKALVQQLQDSHHDLKLLNDVLLSDGGIKKTTDGIFQMANQADKDGLRIIELEKLLAEERSKNKTITEGYQSLSRLYASVLDANEELTRDYNDLCDQLDAANQRISELEGRQSPVSLSPKKDVLSPSRLQLANPSGIDAEGHQIVQVLFSSENK